jgi:hypothetical protein
MVPVLLGISALTGKARIVGFLGCLMIVGIVSTSPAFAGHRNNATSTNDRDNNDQQYNRIDLTDAGFQACVWGALRLDNTEITISVGSADIHCHDAHYTGDWFGLTQCTDVNWWNGKCDHYKLHFNLKHYGQINTDFEQDAYEYIGCHEFGHTSSVGHRSSGTSCMRNGSGVRHYDDHDRNAIDADG